MRYRFLLCPIVTALACCADVVAADANEAATDAIQAALARNIDHAKEWLEQKDFKSVAQSAGGMQLLTDLLKARSDDAAWQAAITASTQRGNAERDAC